MRLKQKKESNGVSGWRSVDLDNSGFSPGKRLIFDNISWMLCFREVSLAGRCNGYPFYSSDKLETDPFSGQHLVLFVSSDTTLNLPGFQAHKPSVQLDDLLHTEDTPELRWVFGVVQPEELANFLDNCFDDFGLSRDPKRQQLFLQISTTAIPGKLLPPREALWNVYGQNDDDTLQCTCCIGLKRKTKMTAITKRECHAIQEFFSAHHQAQIQSLMADPASLFALGTGPPVPRDKGKYKPLHNWPRATTKVMDAGNIQELPYSWRRMLPIYNRCRPIMMEYVVVEGKLRLKPMSVMGSEVLQCFEGKDESYEYTFKRERKEVLRKALYLAFGTPVDLRFFPPEQPETAAKKVQRATKAKMRTFRCETCGWTNTGQEIVIYCVLCKYKNKQLDSGEENDSDHSDDGMGDTVRTNQQQRPQQPVPAAGAVLDRTTGGVHQQQQQQRQQQHVINVTDSDGARPQQPVAVQPRELVHQQQQQQQQQQQRPVPVAGAEAVTQTVRDGTTDGPHHHQRRQQQQDEDELVPQQQQHQNEREPDREPEREREPEPEPNATMATNQQRRQQQQQQQHHEAVTEAVPDEASRVPVQRPVHPQSGQNGATDDALSNGSMSSSQSPRKRKASAPEVTSDTSMKRPKPNSTPQQPSRIVRNLGGRDNYISGNPNSSSNRARRKHRSRSSSSSNRSRRTVIYSTSSSRSTRDSSKHASRSRPSRDRSKYAPSSRRSRDRGHASSSQPRGAQLPFNR